MSAVRIRSGAPVFRASARVGELGWTVNPKTILLGINSCIGFTAMNYNKIYDDLINRGKVRSIDAYTETHHIIPRCLGGTDDPNNLVKLTPEEHYLAHQLLVKIYPNNASLIKAAQMMIPNRSSNKLYGWIRRRFAEAQSAAQAGEKNSQHGTMWIHHKELRVSKKVKSDYILHSDWELGRIVDFDAYYRKQEEAKLAAEIKAQKKKLTPAQTLRKIKTKHSNFRKTEGYRRAKSIKLYSEFKESRLSLRKFAATKKIVPMTLSNWFNEFIPEYEKVVPRTSANKQI